MRPRAGRASGRCGCDSLALMRRSPYRRFVLGALLGALLLAPVQALGETPASPLAEAERALDEGRAADAVEIYRKLAAERPDDPRLQALLGRALSLADRYGESAEALQKAVNGGVSDLRTLLFLGSALWESGRPDEADPVLARAAAAARGTGAEFLAQQQLGRLRLWDGRPDAALPALERAVALRPDAPTPRLDLARALDGAGRTEDAVAAYRAVLERAPDSHHAHWGLAQALLRLGRRDEAAAELAKYKELYAVNQERTRELMLQRSEIDRGWHLIGAGKPAEAEAVFRKLIEGYGVGVDPLLGLARALAGQGDHAGAAEALERAVSLAPDRQDLRRLLAQERLAAEGS